MILAAVELAAPGIQLVLRCSQAASHPHTLEGEGAAVGLFGHGSFEKAECIYMTNEELASMIQSGERGKVLELWEQVRRFACQQGKKWAAYHGHGMEIEDYAQVGFLAMLDALGSWKRAGGSFITWYAMRLKAAFTASSGQRTQRDRMDPLQTSMSLEMPLQDGEGKQSVPRFLPSERYSVLSRYGLVQLAMTAPAVLSSAFQSYKKWAAREWAAHLLLCGFCLPRTRFCITAF